jgi:hypothetical protein
MLSSFRLGTVAILAMGALTAGCAGPMSFAPQGDAQTSSSGLPLHASVYDNDPRFYEPRTYRSKCDDLTSISQRAGCYQQEREEQLMLEDGQD